MVDMAKKRYVNTRFWSDGWVVSLDPLERYLFLYFLTNEHTDISGVYELPLIVMSRETGMEEEMLKNMLPRYEEKIMYINGWVCIKNFLRHQVINSKVLEGVKRSVSEVPDEIKAEFSDNGIDLDRLYIESEIPKPRLRLKPLGRTASSKLESPRSKLTILDDDETVQKLQAQFSKVDVRGELLKIKDWLRANGKRKKDYVAFARNWLRKAEQEAKQRGGSSVFCPQCGERVMASHFKHHSCVQGTSKYAQKLSAAMPTL